MFGLLARVATGRRSKWVVLVCWLVLVGVFGPLQGKLADVTVDDDASSLPEATQSRQVADLLKERFPRGDPPRRSALVVYHRDGGLTEADQRRTLADAERLAQVEGSTGEPFAGFAPMAPPGLVSEEGDTALTSIGFPTDDPAELEGPVEEIREIVGIGERDGLAVNVTGDAALEVDFESEFERGETRLLFVTAFLVLGLLIAIYRSPLIALVPLTTVGFAYGVAGGIVYLLADGGLQVTDVATALLLVLMFGAGTDYCLLLVARYAEQLRRTEDHHEALRAALPRAAPAMTASGLTVAAALLALLVADLGSTRNLGPINAIGIVLVLAAGLTLLPALLAIVGRRGFWPSRKLVEYRPEQPAQPQLLPGLGPLTLPTKLEDRHPSVREREGIWRRVGGRVLRRPGLALAVSVVALGIGAIGLTSYESSGDFLAQFRSDVDSTRGFDQLAESFPAGALAPLSVLVERGDGPVREADVAEVMQRLDGIEGVAGVAGAPDESTDGRVVSLNYTFEDDPYENAALDRVVVMRDAIADLGPDLRGLVGETSAAQLDLRETAQRDLQLVVPVILLVILVILMLLLRAVVAPLYLIGTVIVSFFGTLGISLVLFEVVLGETGYDPQLPTFAFMFLVALGVDYNIFLMDRVREESRVHGTHEGVLRALAATGPVITSAGIILAGTFAALASIPITILVEMGIAVALGVLIDTFLVRTIMVPAIVRLVGERSWWPSRLSDRPPAPPGPPATGAPGGPLAQAAAGKLPPTPPA
ncbi:MAG: MMPL family transporter [Thermoleophilaceae bacterium]